MQPGAKKKKQQDEVKEAKVLDKAVDLIKKESPLPVYAHLQFFFCSHDQ